MKRDKQGTITESLRWAGNSFLLESLFEQAPLGLCIVDEKFKFVKVSKFLAHQINGLSVEEHLGKTLSQVLGRKEWSKLRPYYVRALSGEYIHDVHIIVQKPDNPETERHFLVTLYPLPEIQDGKLIGCLVQEVTRQYQAEDELLSYQNRLEMAQNAGGVGVFDWDFETNEVWSSPEEIQLFELNTNNSSKDNHWLKRIHPEDKSRILKLIEVSSENHETFDTEFRIVLPQDRVRWIRGKGKFFYNDKNEAVRLLGVNYDVTFRKKEELFLKFKAESSRLLTSTDDYKKTLQKTCDLGVKYVADWCGIDILDGNDFVQVALSHKNPKKIAYAKKIRERFPASLSNNAGLAYVIETQKPLFIPEVSPKENYKELPQEQRKIAEKLKLKSVIIVPLCIQKKTIGAVTFVLAESLGRYTESDVELAQQFALRASLFLENVQLYSQIEEERKRLVKLLENVPCIVFETKEGIDDPEYRTTFINSYATQMLGYPIKTWLTVPRFGQTLVHPEDKERVILETRKYLQEGVSGSIRYRWKTKDGKYLWAESHISPVLDSHGKTCGIRGVVTDISEPMKLESRKDEFIATASHELKTPLTSLKVFTQVLKASKEIGSAKKLTQYVNRMEKEIDRLTELVFDLLDLSKIQRGQLSLDKKVISLTKLIKETIEAVQPTLTHKIIFKSNKQCYVLADELRLSQVFSNLISNAAKYSPDASEILIELLQEEKKVVVSVQDFGIGIAPEYQANIFQRFYRVFDEKDKTFPGLGMGLFISKTIVGKHDGQLWVKSQPQKGSTFYVSLPTRAVRGRKDEKSSDN